MDQARPTLVYSAQHNICIYVQMNRSTGYMMVYLWSQYSGQMSVLRAVSSVSKLEQLRDTGNRIELLCWQIQDGMYRKMNK